MSKVSVIVRTKNEEKWIALCLEGILNQSHKNLEIIVVDDNSTDHTLELVSKFPVKLIKYEGDYKPGKCLNVGFKQATGEFIACISGHCIPVNSNWIANLLKNLEQADVAGVYGRQEPLPFTPDSDKRDLLTIFGLDRKVQKKDSFFHNANSMVRKSLWQKYPWDENTTNIEDRLWAKTMLGLGMTIVYEPEASVFHWHGIHQDGNEERCRNVVRILESLSLVSDSTSTLKSAKGTIKAVIPIRGKIVGSNAIKMLELTIQNAKNCKGLEDVIVSTDDEETAEMAKSMGASAPFLRPAELSNPYTGVLEVLDHTYTILNKNVFHSDTLMLLTMTYPFRPKNMLEDLIQEFIDKDLDLLMPAQAKATPFFKKTEAGYEWLDEGFAPRRFKDPIFVGAPGCGMLIKARLLKQKNFSTAKIGLFPIEDQFTVMEITKSTDEALVSNLLNQYLSRSSL